MLTILWIYNWLWLNGDPEQIIPGNNLVTYSHGSMKMEMKQMRS